MGKKNSLATLLFDPRDLSFPIRDQPRPDESGHGYALRMVSENHLVGLQQVKRWLGKSQFAALDSEDAPLLHSWFGADVESLRFALGRIATGRGEIGYEYAGHFLGRSYFLNRSYPRLCPECVEERGLCKIAWDISLVVACDRHRAMLTNRCEHCLKSITWNRAALDVCNCGVRFLDFPRPEAPTLTESQFAAWVGSRIALGSSDFRKESERPQGLTALMTLIWPLSLDGGMHVAYALGTAAGYDDQENSVAAHPRDSLKKARYVLKMASELAGKIVRLEPVSFRVSRPSVVVGLLAESASAQATPEDRSLAQSILLTVLHQKSTRWTSVHPQLSQIPLF